MNSYFPFLRSWFLLLVMLMISIFSYDLQAENVLTISGVSTDRIVISENQPVSIRFNLSKEAQAGVRIYDSQNYLVRNIGSSDGLIAGDHELIWDGKDSQGRWVNGDVYYYVIEAKSENGESALYDLTDKSGGQTVTVENITYNSESEQVSYSVAKPSRVYLRTGIKNGFVQRTLINNAVRMPGKYDMAWDGMDEDGAFSLKHHSKLKFYGEAYSLSRNALVVEHKNLPTIALFNEEKRKIDHYKRKIFPRGKGLNYHAYHSVDQCRDFKINITFMDSVEKNEQGWPVINGKTKIRIGINPADLKMIEAERSELVMFLGQDLIYENEVSYYPYNWEWAPEKLAPGKYYLTAFIVGFNEHFGKKTVPIFIQ